PFPFNGGTTTVEALWAGVPVVTLAGDHYVSRMGVSHLSAVGLGELIAATPDEYLAAAVGLARDPSRLVELRATLAERMRNTICDGERFTRGLEDAFRAMWRTWCQSGSE
ncbi:MAG: tetratricopeptide repeat protein, partial [Candidatus Dormibacteraceae bacterium]